MSCQPVAGVWSRLFEEDPLGDAENADRTTLVLWTQTPSGLYVDLRLPQGSPGRTTDTNNNGNSNAVSQKDPTALRATDKSLTMITNGNNANMITRLAQQKSFAGELTYKLGDTTDSKEALAKDSVLKQHAQDKNAALALNTCFWRRDMDYQPPSGGLDIGVCASYSPMHPDNGSVDLRETGDDGSYAEGWHRLPHTHQGPFLAMSLVEENQSNRTGVWVQTGNRFAYAIGRPNNAETAKALQCSHVTATISQQVGKTLQEVMQSLKDDAEKLAALGTYVGLAGEIDTNGKWQILDSTNPALVGCLLVGDSSEHCCSILKSHQEQVNVGDILEQVVSGKESFVRKWKMVELSDGCTPPFSKAS